jgi:hypothetical protein
MHPFLLVLTRFVQDVIDTQLEIMLIDDIFQCLSYGSDVLEY